VVSGRPGKTALGCLFALLLVVAAGYFGVNVGEVYYRYLVYRNAMAQEARLAAHNPDDVIRQHLRALADSLGLPEGARTINIRRSTRYVSIWSEYYDRVELPLLVHEFHFTPRAEQVY
jgi:hypothetical protein